MNFEGKIYALADAGKIERAVAERIIANPEILEAELSLRQNYVPTKSFVPNRGQERFLSVLNKPDYKYYSDGYPPRMIFTGGNGVGKTTTACAEILAGICLGKEALNPDYGAKRQFYDLIENIKKTRRQRLQVRIECDSSDIETGGSFREEILNWIPSAIFHKAQSGGVSSITIGDNEIAVRTYGQELNAHAGTNCDIIIANEPPPKKIWNECKARLRKGGLSGNGGWLLLFCTPLYGVEYLFDEITADGAENTIYHTEISMWDNCKDIPEARGHLSKAFIDDFIASLAHSPEQIEARVYGRFMHLSGSIFKNFDRDVNVCVPFILPKNFIIGMTLDPHITHFPYVIWWALSPTNELYIIAEYPHMVWTSAQNSTKPLKQICGELRNIEMGIVEGYKFFKGIKVSFRYGDPNAMRTKTQTTALTIMDEYSTHGFDFDCSANDNIQIGLDKIREYLFFDTCQPVSTKNKPRLFLFNNCQNTINAFQRFSYEGDKGYNVKWKCPIDCVRYTVMLIGDYYNMKAKVERNKSKENREKYKRDKWTNAYI